MTLYLSPGLERPWGAEYAWKLKSPHHHHPTHTHTRSLTHPTSLCLLPFLLGCLIRYGRWEIQIDFTPHHHHHHAHLIVMAAVSMVTRSETSGSSMSRCAVIMTDLGEICGRRRGNAEKPLAAIWLTSPKERHTGGERERKDRWSSWVTLMAGFCVYY